jgi:hypothetical protein
MLVDRVYIFKSNYKYVLASIRTVVAELTTTYVLISEGVNRVSLLYYDGNNYQRVFPF